MQLEDILPKCLQLNEAQEGIQTICSDQEMMESKYLRNDIVENVHSYLYGNKMSSTSSSGFYIENLLRAFLKKRNQII